MKIDKRILKDSVHIKELDFCSLRLMKDGDLPWFVLIPKVEGAVEVTDLDFASQQEMLEEINKISKLIEKFEKVDKINIGILGNIVSQLHVHVIGRYTSDRAWPNAVWGTKTQKSYQGYMAEEWIKRLS